MEKVTVIFQGIGIIIVLFVLELAIVAFVPGFSVPKQRLINPQQEIKAVDTKPPSSKKDVSFQVKGTSISAWLYLPENVPAQVACIIMGHGFGGTRDMGLESYAVRYQEAGFAVLLFDYRHFGESGGEPRHLIWIPYQLEDWSAAIKYARGLKEIDPARIALWGTSMSGGHVIVTAAKDNNIPFPVGMIQGEEEKTRFTWGVRSLPWLILTDDKRVVRAEGFRLSELNEKIKEVSDAER